MALSNGWAFNGAPSERSERPERKRGRRVRCNAMLGGTDGTRSSSSGSWLTAMVCQLFSDVRHTKFPAFDNPELDQVTELNNLQDAL